MSADLSHANFCPRSKGRYVIGDGEVLASTRDGYERADWCMFCGGRLIVEGDRIVRARCARSDESTSWWFIRDRLRFRYNDMGLPMLDLCQWSDEVDDLIVGTVNKSALSALAKLGAFEHSDRGLDVAAKAIASEIDADFAAWRAERMAEMAR